MEKDLILKTDILDIIFEKRNKEYGAYELRKTYNKRLRLLKLRKNRKQNQHQLLKSSLQIM